jgi:hypothetical protein
MSKGVENVQGWIGIVFLVWPIVRVIIKQFGVELPDVGVSGAEIGIASQATGTYLLAKAKPIGKE